MSSTTEPRNSAGSDQAHRCQELSAWAEREPTKGCKAAGQKSAFSCRIATIVPCDHLRLAVENYQMNSPVNAGSRSFVPRMLRVSRVSRAADLGPSCGARSMRRKGRQGASHYFFVGWTISVSDACLRFSGARAVSRRKRRPSFQDPMCRSWRVAGREAADAPAPPRDGGARGAILLVPRLPSTPPPEGPRRARPPDGTIAPFS